MTLDWQSCGTNNNASFGVSFQCVAAATALCFVCFILSVCRACLECFTDDAASDANNQPSQQFREMSPNYAPQRVNPIDEIRGAPVVYDIMNSHGTYCARIVYAGVPPPPVDEIRIPSVPSVQSQPEGGEETDWEWDENNKVFWSETQQMYYDETTGEFMPAHPID